MIMGYSDGDDKNDDVGDYANNNLGGDGNCNDNLGGDGNDNLGGEGNDKDVNINGYCCHDNLMLMTMKTNLIMTSFFING